MPPPQQQQQQQQPPPCVFCGMTFETRELLQDHFRQHGANNGPAGVISDKSDAKSSSAVKEATRLRNQYADKTVVECDVCGQKFDGVSRAINHKFRKHNDHEVRHFCPWCGKRFPIKHVLENHVKLHSDEVVNDEIFKCVDCEVSFFKEEALSYHRTSYHDNALFVNNVIIPPPSKKIYINSAKDVLSAYYCHLCGQEYIIKYNLRRHIADTHGEKSFDYFSDVIKCNICEALFYTEKAYQNHNNFHKPDDMYVIDEEMRLNVVTKVDQDFDLKRVRTLFNGQSYKRRNQYSIVYPKKQNIQGFQTEVEAKDQEHSVTIGDFLKMNKEAFTYDRTLEERNKGEAESWNSENITNSTESVSTPTVSTSEKKPEVKFVTKKELDKLKSKGLIKLTTKPETLANLKKISVVDKKPMEPSPSTKKPVKEKTWEVPVVMLERIKVEPGTVKTETPNIPRKRKR